ncbi:MULTISPECIES: 3-hydroxyacyl-CoA dehydrogenase NAD-binding domain-containing protein [unclassified Sinorhizobium]|uniref:3-hydroxyacyl-CoA dehydrogenase NAD-binding domain-containing protein n=1 Tax=unclassified Sinorhizobium TaxID=2613772 RepID=UPI0024C3CE6D|nr:MULTISPECIES: 3-hydroxyacyl-CoA dehydrogenase NAD-binding domain-containing protein [unclassified Sinorhizobium]MDK1374145.1 3-hydroxyacyl-CoA dehydrogenase NAD-binding domain-containing protein [Sinorhizobium sp. 6-70]MDK1477886.1 3-hydroxyacyl-CoA dehydrogenase NAD-binding domain-containing protein [Sinorhizobium sp. 6-117]
MMPATNASVWKTPAPRKMEFGPRDAAKVFTHWRLSMGPDDIAWLLLDRSSESTNTLSESVLAELDMALGDIEGMGAKGLVIRSTKKGGFIAGADIHDFKGVTEAREVEKRMRRAHEIVDRLAALRIPTVALIHGYCLGGGLELALACKYRMALGDAKLGFPEIMLGLHPGLGGTFRLTALIDPVEAMTMMLMGKTVHGKKAKALGLVDAVIEERHVENAVRAAVAGKMKKDGGNWKSSVFGLRPARQLAARQMRGEAEKRAPKRYYPAPYRLIDLWEEHGGDSKAMQEAEIASFSELLVSETAQNLIRVFFLREKLKGSAKGESGIRHVHVIGAGTMGGDIAAWCAARGLRVTLADLDRNAIARAIGRAAAFYDQKLHSSIERRDALDRLIPDFEGAGAAKADLVIEAVVEKLDVKRKVFDGIEPKMRKDAILATNTSSIPLEALREGLTFPDRLVGLHFFNPVAKMELVEVVAHDQASKATLDRAHAFCGAIDRLPAAVKSAPGFLVNRALTPYLTEAFVMLDEGTPKETIDRAAEEFGMPMGPIELADRIGLDIGLEVVRMLKDRLDDPIADIPAWLEKKVDRGETGRKAGKGLYGYDGKRKPKKGSGAPGPGPEMAERLLLPMLNTCVRCLREGIVEDEDTLDGAMIFATGFAPFRGGPMHYARRRGASDILETLRRLEQQHGPRFAPDKGWDAMSGET